MLAGEIKHVTNTEKENKLNFTLFGYKIGSFPSKTFPKN